MYLFENSHWTRKQLSHQAFLRSCRFNGRCIINFRKYCGLHTHPGKATVFHSVGCFGINNADSLLRIKRSSSSEKLMYSLHVPTHPAFLQECLPT